MCLDFTDWAKVAIVMALSEYSYHTGESNTDVSFRFVARIARIGCSKKLFNSAKFKFLRIIWFRLYCQNIIC